MIPNRRVDRRRQPGIHLFVLLITLFCGCDDKQDAPVDAAVVPLAETEEKNVEKTPPEDGIQDTAKGQVLQAVGKAMKGMDVSLARQSASNRARANLAKLLKEKGYALEPPGVLHNVTIERIWTEGRFVYALGVLPLSNLEKPVNDPNSAPSNSEKGEEPEKSAEDSKEEP